MGHLSICIPTFNRARHLRNCLTSIEEAMQDCEEKPEICVSNNGSTDETEDVIFEFQKKISIKYHSNKKNVGIPLNFLRVVSMAQNEYAWLLGDDDLVMPTGIATINNLISTNPNVDFFYVNSCLLDTEYVFSFKQPFNCKNLPSEMEKFSKREKSGALDFVDLIDPYISFDFLGGMYLAVFRRVNWEKNKHNLDPAAIQSSMTFSHFDNTFPHIKVFASAFMQSKAFFCSKPVSVCLSGAREWSPLYPLVRSVRIVEALGVYRNNGLSFLQFVRCKNSALKFFWMDIALMFKNYRISGVQYVKIHKLILRNLLFPYFYLSLVGLTAKAVVKVTSVFLRKLSDCIGDYRGRMSCRSK